MGRQRHELHAPVIGGDFIGSPHVADDLPVVSPPVGRLAPDAFRRHVIVGNGEGDDVA